MITISKSQSKILGETQVAQRVQKMAYNIRRDFSDMLTNRDSSEIDNAVTRTVSIMRDYGIEQGQHLYLLAAWGVFYGHDFAERLGGGMPEILSDETLTESERIKQLQVCLEKQLATAAT